MKSIAFIPARFAATRFPGKLMQSLGGRSIIRRTYENTVATLLFDEVIVVTDSPVIFDEIVRNGGYAVMSHRTHESGSDRIAEAVASIDVDIVVNVQGDEPFVKKEPLEALLAVFRDPQVQVASLMHEIHDTALVEDPNTVKVVVDARRNALLFSRSVIPFPREEGLVPVYYKHIGIYGYRKAALMNFTAWPAGRLEAIEKLEQLRYLEQGIPVKMVLTGESPVSIDTPEDLERARKLLLPDH